MELVSTEGKRVTNSVPSGKTTTINHDSVEEII